MIRAILNIRFSEKTNKSYLTQIAVRVKSESLFHLNFWFYHELCGIANLANKNVSRTVL